MVHEMICIVCPKGCHLKVDDESLEVTGNLCPRGDRYGKKEIKNPTRVLTTTVTLNHPVYPRLPVVTDGEVPKGELFHVMEIINQVTVDPPIKVGEVIVKDLAGFGVDLMSSRTIE